MEKYVLPFLLNAVYRFGSNVLGNVTCVSLKMQRFCAYIRLSYSLNYLLQCILTWMVTVRAEIDQVLSETGGLRNRKFSIIPLSVLLYSI